MSQLITDFGRTHNLVQSAQSKAKAELENEKATEQDITLTVAQAFYQALTSPGCAEGCRRNCNARQATVDQVGALTKAKLKSDLDLSFANVQISQAKLLLLDAQNNAANAMAALNKVFGSERDEQYTLVDETAANPEPGAPMPRRLLQSAFDGAPRSRSAQRQITPPPANSAPPSAICGCRPSRRWRLWVALLYAPIRFSPPGTALPAQTSTFPSSTDFSSTPRTGGKAARQRSRGTRAQPARRNRARFAHRGAECAERFPAHRRDAGDAEPESNLALDLS